MTILSDSFLKMNALQLTRIETKISNAHWVPFTICFAALRVVVALVFYFLVQTSGTHPSLKGFEEFDSVIANVLVVVVLGPFIETYLMLFLPFRFLSSKIHPLYIVLISSIVFGALHHYSVLYMFHGFFGGLVYSMAYYLKRNSNNPHPLLITTFIHSTFNLVGWVYNHIG